MKNEKIFGKTLLALLVGSMLLIGLLPYIGTARNARNSENDCEWVEETAWMDCKEYENQRGRWKWRQYGQNYPGGNQSLDLVAGRDHIYAGTVWTNQTNDMVDITVVLDEGWRFQDVEENVKVQDYDDHPTEHPIPGQFDHKGTADPEYSTFTITVPLNTHYGVHVDLEWLDCE